MTKIESSKKIFGPLLIATLISIVTLNGIIWFAPILFSGCKITDRFCHFWYYLSQSGGTHFSPYILIALCLLFATRGANRKKGIVGLASSLILIGGLLGGVAAFNEFVTKPAIAAKRPSIEFLAHNGVLDENHYYNDLKSKEDRRIYINEALAQPNARDKILVGERIDPLVLNHWVEESGYSFPSGHSLNAFLLGTLAALFFLFYFDGWARSIFLIPLVWAILVSASRSAIGAHNPIDICAGSLVGALLGLALAALLLRTKTFHRHSNLI